MLPGLYRSIAALSIICSACYAANNDKFERETISTPNKNVSLARPLRGPSRLFIDTIRERSRADQSGKTRSPTAKRRARDQGSCALRIPGGNKPHQFSSDECCDKRLEHLIKGIGEIIRRLPKLGDVAKKLQEKAQQIFGKAFEVVMSKGNFGISTNYKGKSSCKVKVGDHYVIVYATPVKYDLRDSKRESFLASLDSQEPLGATLAAGIRARFPKLTHSRIGQAVQRVVPLLRSRLSHGPSGGPINGPFGASGGPFGGPPRIPFVGPFGFRPRAHADPQLSLSEDDEENNEKSKDQAKESGRSSSAEGGKGSGSFDADECQSSSLGSLMKDAVAVSMNTPKLGDAAKFVQRRAQQEFGKTFEVIMSKGDFAVSTHYTGSSSCKMKVGDYHIVAYETPEKYDPFDMKAEDMFSVLDSDEPLGATRPLNVRDRFPDVRHNIHAGEDLTGQPSLASSRAVQGHVDSVTPSTQLPAPETADTLQQADADPAPAVPVVDTGNGEPPANQIFRQEVVPSVTDPDDSVETAVTEPGVTEVPTTTESARSAAPGPPTALQMKESSSLPPGTHCDSGNRGGNKCCDGALYETMRDAVDDLASSPQFGPQAAGVVANLIKARAQRRFDHTYEVIVSSGDFAMSSYSFGDGTCKFQQNGFTILAYETPRQATYDPSYVALEEYLSSISNNEPLGTAASELPGIRDRHTPLQLETTGPRAGLPMGSHCGSERGGSKCCSGPLFNAMNNAYNNLRQQPNFDQYNQRAISQALYMAAENAIGHSMEVMVATDDFVISSSYDGDATCKFRIDNYYVQAWATPVPYPLNSANYADIGRAKYVGCAPGISGSGCCDGDIQFEVARAVDELKETPNYNKYDTDRVARTIARSVQRRYGSRFETIVSRSDFSWSTALDGEHSCKLDAGGYHALTFQSSPLPPQPGEFAEPGVEFVPTFPQSSVFNAQPMPFDNVGQPPLIQPLVQPPLVQPPLVQPLVPQPPVFFPPPPVPAAVPVAPPVAFAAGGGGGACFSTDTWLTTPNGKRRMDQIAVGDYVLTANLSHSYYAPITLWMHREPDVMESFTTIMTEYGKMLALTPKHLIFRNKCDENYADFVDVLPANSEAVYADELVVGDCMMLLYKGRFRQQRLMEITTTKRKGIFAPLTSNGRILVNDMLASCYSDNKEVTIQTTYFSVLVNVRRHLNNVLGAMGSSVVELPIFTNFSKELLKLVIPYIK